MGEERSMQKEARLRVLNAEMAELRRQFVSGSQDQRETMVARSVEIRQQIETILTEPLPPPMATHKSRR